MLKQGGKGTFQTVHIEMFTGIRNVELDRSIVHKADRIDLFHLLHQVFYSDPMLCMQG